ncbi:MAG: hypothetical protein QM690_17275 [Sphingobium sp.]
MTMISRNIVSFKRTWSSTRQSREWGFVRPFLFGFGMTCFFMLSGCGVATLPVKATGKVVDWSTMSQDEADRNRGREMRKRDEAYRDCVREGYRDC